MLPLTAGCARMTATVETKAPAPVVETKALAPVVDNSKSEVCSKWKGIGWSRKDTPQTIEGVKLNNARRQAWCRAS
jgi:hypothetical protein